MKSLEIEIKFYIPDIDAIRARIRSLGAEPKASGFETNIRFDDASQHLKQEFCPTGKIMISQDNMSRRRYGIPRW